MNARTPGGVHVTRLMRVRTILCSLLILYSLVIAVMYVVGEPRAWGKALLVIAALVMVSATWALTPPRVPSTRGIGSRILLVIVLLLGWFLGGAITSARASEAQQQTTALMVLTFFWPLALITVSIALVVIRKLYPRAARKDEILAQRQREIEYEQLLTRELNQIDTPSAPGAMTGFEPAQLDGIDWGKPPHMYGVPGEGLTAAGFSPSALEKGQAGERNFARALTREGLLDRFATFWSVHMPDETVGASKTLQADIDAVIVTGQRILLVDVKNYVQGDVTWTPGTEADTLRIVDNPTGGYVGGPRSMSSNMALAHERVTEKMHGLGIRLPVESVVMFMPTQNGVGTVDPALTWPGGVPVRTLPDVVETLRRDRDFRADAPESEHIVRVFRWLVKDASGSAPRLGQVQPRAAASGSTAAAPAAASHSPQATTPSPPTPAHHARSDETASAPHRGPTPAVSDSPARTCTECGARMEQEQAFCYTCGSSAA